MTDIQPDSVAVAMVVTALIVATLIGVVSDCKRIAARTGIMVIDGTAYVLVPARRGGE